MKTWYYALNGQQQGPVGSDELRRLESAGTIHSLTLVWCPEMTEWTALGSVPANLLPPLAGQPPAVPAMVPGASGAYGASPGTISPSRVSSGWQRGPEQAHQFEFHGRAGEYFRIWIVNVVLTVITFGIYHAWAKVRTLRYFYGNTRLDGKPFDFTGNPVAILKGNLIFGGLFVLYVVLGSVAPALAAAILLMIMAISPWLIQKALRFRAHNTVHRNVRFNFRGTVSDAYTVFLWLGFLVAFTVGLILPYIHFSQKKYFLGNMGWGECRASMNGVASYFYKKALPFLILFGVFIAGIIAAVSIPAFNAARKAAEKRAGASSPIISQLQTGPVLAQEDVGDTFTKQLREKIEEQIAANPEMSEEQKQRLRKRAEDLDIGAPGAMRVAIMLGVAAVYIFFLIAFLVYQIRTNNYSLNVTQWGDVGHLESTVRVRDMIWLFITNALAVLFSLGLLAPWVRVRMARYRASRTKFIAAGSLDAVAQSVGTGDSAMGDAGADIFDFDIGF